MDIKILTHHEISFKKRLEIVGWKKTGKRYREFETIVGCSRNSSFPVCKKFFKSRTVKILQRVGRNSRKLFEVMRLC